MSWIDRLNNVEVTIRCGDGRTYTPLWRNASRSKRYNYSAYNFINQPGTLIDRREAEGNQHTLELHFTGQDHLDVARNFELSADDPRPWTITHPYYGDLLVQPLGYERGNAQENKTSFITDIWETIPRNFPVERLVADDQVADRREQTADAALTSLDSQIPVFDAATRASALASLQEVDTSISAGITDSAVFARFKTMVAQTRQQINNSLSTPIDSMRSMLAAISFPIENIQRVRDRFAVYQELRNRLGSVLLADRLNGGVSANDAKLYEVIVSTIVASMADTALTPGEGDYTIRTEVAEVNEDLRMEYGEFIGALDAIQASRSDMFDTFTPDDLTNRLLNETVQISFSNLFEIAFEARQERTIFLEYDSNPILLTHRFYGLDENDENLQFFIDSNDLSLDEIISIKKGKTIIYYR